MKGSKMIVTTLKRLFRTDKENERAYYDYNPWKSTRIKVSPHRKVSCVVAIHRIVQICTPRCNRNELPKADLSCCIGQIISNVVIVT